MGLDNQKEPQLDPDYELPKRGIPCFGGNLDGRIFNCASGEYPPGFNPLNRRVLQRPLVPEDGGGDYLLYYVPVPDEWIHAGAGETRALYVYRHIKPEKLALSILRQAIWYWRS